jgi:hypothetical protein
MRNTFIILLLLLLVFGSSNLAKAQSLAGKWMNIDKSDTTILELRKDSVYFIYLLGEEETIGGIKSYDEIASDDDSVFLDHKYSVNTSVFPHRLTLTAYYTGTDSFYYILPIVFEFRENNSIAVIAYDEGIFREDGDDPEKILKEFYTSTPKIDEKKDEVIVFKPLK